MLRGGLYRIGRPRGRAPAGRRRDGRPIPEHPDSAHQPIGAHLVEVRRLARQLEVGDGELAGRLREDVLALGSLGAPELVAGRARDSLPRGLDACRRHLLQLQPRRLGQGRRRRGRLGVRTAHREAAVRRHRAHLVVVRHAGGEARVGQRASVEVGGGDQPPGPAGVQRAVDLVAGRAGDGGPGELHAVVPARDRGRRRRSRQLQRLALLTQLRIGVAARAGQHPDVVKVEALVALLGLHLLVRAGRGRVLRRRFAALPPVDTVGAGRGLEEEASGDLVGMPIMRDAGDTAAAVIGRCGVLCHAVTARHGEGIRRITDDAACRRGC